MTLPLALVLMLLVLAIVLFAINWPRMDAVALIVLTALPLTGAVTMGEALAGFADANIVLIAALFVIGDGLVRTGVARQIGDGLLKHAGSNEFRLLALLMIAVCGLGSVMSSTAVTAIFIPVALRIAQQTGTAPSRLMMPLSVAALISGMTTLVATAPNLVVNSELMRQSKGEHFFSFFAFTPFGLPILLFAVPYMYFARTWLSAGGGPASTSAAPGLAEWVELYRLGGREFRVGVTPGSPLVGQMIQDVGMRDTSGASVVAIERAGRLVQPTPQTTFHAGDVLLVDLFAPGVDVEGLIEKYALELMPLSGGYFSDRLQSIGLAEVIVPADSDLIGQTVADARFRDRTGLTVIGLRRGREAMDRGLRQERLAVGDTLLVVGPWKAIERLEPDRDGVLVLRLPAEAHEVLPVPGKAAHAVGCLLLTVGLMVSGVVPNVQAALIGCLLMGALGVVDLNSAYRCIDWKTIVLIVGMLPFSAALQNTGGVKLMADGLMSVIGGSGPTVVLGSLFVLTAGLGLFISNTATAVLMAPVALSIAAQLGHSPYPYAMTVALAASTAFMTPVSSPVNTLVVGPGDYTFGDFVKVGTPLALVVVVVCVFLVPVLLPLN